MGGQRASRGAAKSARGGGYLFTAAVLLHSLRGTWTAAIVEVDGTNRGTAVVFSMLDCGAAGPHGTAAHVVLFGSFNTAPCWTPVWLMRRHMSVNPVAGDLAPGGLFRTGRTPPMPRATRIAQSAN